MNALRILHTESSMELGGQEYRVLHEAAGMIERGHHVTLVVQPGSQLAQESLKKGISVELLSMSRIRWVPLILDFGRVITHYHPHILNTHGSIDSWTASLAGKINKRQPVIIRTRHKSTPITDTLRHRVLYRTLPHAVVTTGEIIKEAMIHNNGVQASKVFSIPTGVDLRRFHLGQFDGSVKEQLGFPLTCPLVGTVVFLRDYKGIDDFLDAARTVRQRYPDARFLVVGDGPEKDRLSQKIVDLGLTPYFLLVGFREDIPHLLSVLDVFVLPSIRGEGIPQALLQAMAMERPVVATTVGGIPEVVQHRESGLLCLPNNPLDLADHICQLLGDPSLGVRLGKRARQVIEKTYSFHAMLEATEWLYQKLMTAQLTMYEEG